MPPLPLRIVTFRYLLYSNRISYIRELRPYMYWLKFLDSGEAAGDLDWKAIGGTWGSATSKLMTWRQVNPKLPADLMDICEKIRSADAKNGETLSQYVLKFFDDMFLHFYNLRQHLKPGAQIFYILGNSSFYGNYVDTESYITEMLNELGYSDVASNNIRKRNCNKGLYEYCIRAKWDRL